MSVENDPTPSRQILLTLLDQIEDLLKDVREAVLDGKTGNQNG